jgi:hypothetical protein
MSELMLMQDQYLDFLNQSEFYQLMPFIILSLTACFSLAIFTEIPAEGVLAICFNPISFLVYWVVGVVPFITIPIIVAFIALYFLINYAVNLKKKSNRV